MGRWVGRQEGTQEGGQEGEQARSKAGRQVRREGGRRVNQSAVRQLVEIIFPHLAHLLKWQEWRTGSRMGMHGRSLFHSQHQHTLLQHLG